MLYILITYMFAIGSKCGASKVPLWIIFLAPITAPYLVGKYLSNKIGHANHISKKLAEINSNIIQIKHNQDEKSRPRY